MTGQIVLDLDQLASHTGRVRAAGDSFGTPISWAAVTGIDVGAFGVLCSQLNAPVQVVSTLARETLVEASNAVSRTAGALHDVSGDFDALEETTRVALQELGELTPSIAMPSFTPPLPGSRPVTSDLIGESVDLSTPFTGLGIIEDGEALRVAIASGDWAGKLLAGGSLALGSAAAVVDPFGTLAGMGLSWTLEHMEPIRGWVNDLTGDAGQVAGFAQTWHNIAGLVTDTADDLDASMGQIADMDGATIAAYRAFQSDVVEHVRAAGTWAGAFASGLELCSSIVQGVHDLVRELFSSLVGSIVVWAAELGATALLAAPLVAEQIVLRTATVAARAGRLIARLMRAIDEFITLLRKLGRVFADLTRVLKRVLGGGTPLRAPRKTLAARPLVSSVPGSGVGATFRNKSMLDDHFGRHGNDFGAQTVTEYAGQADDFLTGTRSADTLEYTRPASGATVLFNPVTDEFGIVSADGRIVTYYRPDPARHGYATNLEYFHARKH